MTDSESTAKARDMIAVARMVLMMAEREVLKEELNASLGLADPANYARRFKVAAEELLNICQSRLNEIGGNQ